MSIGWWRQAFLFFRIRFQLYSTDPHSHLTSLYTPKHYTPPSFIPHQASVLAQLFPSLGARLIMLVTTLLVPKDPFSKPYVDIIIEGARSC